MRPFFFGEGDRPLFGAYHERSSSGPARDAAVLIAYPGVHEYNMAHWSMRKLAAMLAREGFPVMRFDYRGSGDSAGETGSGNPAEWIEDIRLAAQELHDRSGARALAIVGMRLGASLAALAVEQGLEARDLVLWDPVVDGAAYIRELEQLDRSQRLHRLYETRPHASSNELLGYPLLPAQRSELSRVDLRKLRVRAGQAISLVSTEDRPEYIAFARALTAQHARLRASLVAEGGGAAAAEAQAAILWSKPLTAITESLVSAEAA
jgi:pimeloyl-ACP methyl ester carboxylesterase